MEIKSVNVLLIEDNPVETRLIQAVLKKPGAGLPFVRDFDLRCTNRLSTALARLAEASADVILLDLSLPDSEGIETLLRVRAQEPDVPVVVLTGSTDEALAVEAVRAGAQDFLVKGQIESQSLVRAVRYAIERHRLLRSLSLFDELTGLYNRRGFLTLAEQHLKTAQRTGSGFLLVYADMDGLKAINDRFGHHEGSQAIARAGDMLRKTFRTSDILARLGGDEFTVLAPDVSDEHPELIIARLRRNLDEYNGLRLHPYDISLSVGAVRYDPRADDTLEAALARADEAMYLDKQNKRRSAGAAARPAESVDAAAPRRRVVNAVNA